MISVNQSIQIERSPKEVFDFMSNPGNITQWRSDVAKVSEFDGKVKAGITFRETVRGFGTFTMRTFINSGDIFAFILGVIVYFAIS